MLTRRTALLSASALALSACATSSGGASFGDTAAFNQFLDDAFEVDLVRSPQLATALGDRRGYDRWDDPSEAAADEDLRILRENVAEMRARFSPDRLDDVAKLSFRLRELQLARAEESDPWRDHGYIFNQQFGAQSQAPAFLINQHRVESVSDAEAYVARLHALKPGMDILVARSDAAHARGLSPPRFVYDYVLSDCRNIIAGAPFADGDDSPIWSDFKSKVETLQTADSEKADLLAAGRAALVDSVKPAYESVIAAMERQKETATVDDGVWRFADGASYYAHQLKRMTTTNMTADEVHDVGLAEVARIQNEMRTIMRAVNFDGDLRAFFDFMGADPRFYVADTPEGKASYVAMAAAAIDAVRPRLPEYFGRIPRAPVEVRQVEAFRERSAGLAFYNRPSPDGSRPGIYYVNTFITAAIPTYQVEALAFHEGIPGHHMQIAIAQELEGIPRFRRLGGYTAYSEGWGLYAEYLGKEMGFYQDPYSDFGRLTLELHRAVRLVVDTGLHHKRWTRQQAIDYTLANKPDAEAQARRDIDRYIVMPGQATAYKIGQMEILRLREEARTRLGAAFTIKGFHDLVLEGGAVPLDVLGERIRAWQGG